MPVYRALSATLAPFARRRLARAGLAFKEVAGREDERRGQVPRSSGELWIHAASVGELNAARPLIERLLSHPRTCRPGNDDAREASGIVLTTLTPTAAAQATARYAARGGIRTLLAPLDRPANVNSWLDRTRPDRLLLIETELWPELLTACHRRRIPVAMANARLSARAARGYRRFAGLFRPLLAGIEPIACQSGTDAARFAELGARKEAIEVTGNVKFDPIPTPPMSTELSDALEAFGDRPAWVAGSTHRGEELIVARAHRAVLKADPAALLLLVPRHPERATEAIQVLRDVGLAAARLSDLPPYADDDSPDTRSDIACLVIDRVGLLSSLYGVARANFVGGSLVEGIGGHNLIEAAMAGRPVLTGPFTEDQDEAAAGLEDVGGLARVASELDLAEAVRTILVQDHNAHRLLEMPDKAAVFLSTQRGALDRTIEVLSAWLDGGPMKGSSEDRSPARP